MCMFILSSTVDLEMSLMIVMYTLFSMPCMCIIKHCDDCVLVAGIFHCQASVIFSGNQHMVVLPVCESMKQFFARPIHTIHEAFPYFPVHTTRCTLPFLSYFTILDPKFIIVDIF